MGSYSMILHFSEKQPHVRLQGFNIHQKAISFMESYSIILYFGENSHTQDYKCSLVTKRQLLSWDLTLLYCTFVKTATCKIARVLLTGVSLCNYQLQDG